MKDFHKDEVRAIGCDLGLPVELTARHPFPGPGLAIRVLCTNGEINMERDFSETQVHMSKMFSVNEHPICILGFMQTSC